MQRVKKQAAQYLDKQRKHKRFTKVVTVLAGAVVFCTTYALILPAITMTTPLDCELPEHTHTEECYVTEMVTPEPQIVCGLEEEEAHAHDESCCGASTVVCGLEEQDAHTHDDSCYIDGELVCETEETEGHVHTDDCFVTELVCGKTETEGHTHTDECMVVGEPEKQTTLVCEQVEHIHDDSCYLALELDNNIYYCGFDTEHIHDESGYFEDGELKCTIAEHVHTEECLIKPVVVPDPIALDETFTAESEDGAVVIELYVCGEAILPDDAEISEDAMPELIVTESEDEEIRDEYAELAAEEGDIMMVAALEYALVIDGYELDISGCEVEISVTPTEEFQEMLDAPQAIALMSLAADDEDAETDEVEEAYYFSYYTANVGKVGYAVTSGANPSFTVQYYAYLERAVRSSSGTLPVIDTDNGSNADNSNKGGVLPTNGKGASDSPNGNLLAYLVLNDDGTIKTEEKLTEIYREENFEYQKAPGLKYFNIVLKNKNSEYTLNEIWVLKEGKSDESVDENDWDRYPYSETIRFTNRQETVDADPDNFILINQNDVIRLVYDTKKTTSNVPTTFYDYNITNGRLFKTQNDADNNSTDYYRARSLTLAAQSWVLPIYVRTNQQGINSNLSANYVTSSGSRLAFGNVNTGTSLGNEKWNGYYINRYNNNSYQGCTFGIVDSLKADGTIQYASGIRAPKMFNEGTATGKSIYTEHSLDFERVGDTYTLSAVNGTNATDLTKFSHPGNYTSIWTNNFWPMDGKNSPTTDERTLTIDPEFGGTTYSGKIKFKSSENSSKTALPDSDDGKNHNSYFGMNFAVTFELTKNYVGPLEYYFFGDDDMWVFLDGKLVCDIGGVHSSVGEYVNLWDYIDESELVALDEDETKTYTLTFFYTERGASGSTCWMQFTLPTVVGLDLANELEKEVDENNGSLWIEKRLSGVENVDWFRFKLDLKGVNTYDNFVVQNANGEIVSQGDKVKEYITGNSDTFMLRGGDVLVIQKLPAGTTYTITEVDENDKPLAGYHTKTETFLYSTEKASETGEFEKNEVQGATAEGGITVSDITKVIFTNTSSYELPATGGSGTTLLYATGTLLLIAAALLMYKKRHWLFGEEGRA